MSKPSRMVLQLHYPSNFVGRRQSAISGKRALNTVQLEIEGDYIVFQESSENCLGQLRTKRISSKKV